MLSNALYPIFESINFSHSKTTHPYHRLITTNITGEAVEESLEKAKVVFLLIDKDHNGASFNRKLLYSKVHQDHYLLVEEDVLLDYRPLNPEERVHIWVPNEKIKHIESQRTRLLLDAAYAVKKLAERLTQTTLALEEAHEEDSHAECVPDDAIDSIKDKIRKYLSKIENLNDTCKDLTRHHSCFEAMFLVHLIQGNIQKYQKLWIVINEDRGRYTSSKIEMMQPVSFLYLSFEATKISYVTLKYSDPLSNPLEYIHCPEMAPSVEAFYKERIKKTLKDYEEVTPPFSPKERATTLLRLLQGDLPLIRPSQKMPLMLSLLERSLTWE